MKTGAGGKGCGGGARWAGGEGSLREGVGDEDGVEGEGVEVGAGLAAKAAEGGEGRDFLDHGVRLGLVEGCGRGRSRP